MHMCGNMCICGGGEVDPTSRNIVSPRTNHLSGMSSTLLKPVTRMTWERPRMVARMGVQKKSFRMPTFCTQMEGSNRASTPMPLPSKLACRRS